ncbi:unnamed protein product [Ilex paraguariensis]|uniref:Bulb-type lectin domain-containing protein n=1 Tax=Ilex paraguariensis TaxID=185542 RepID=A0ABC8UW30_9AQUA
MATKGRRMRVLLLYLSSFFLFFNFSPAYSETDTIYLGQPLRNWEQLISKNQVFKLQFFSSGMISRSYYVGIFYNKEQRTEKAVWMANRDNPIPDASGNLIIDFDGRLKISYSGGRSAIVFNSLPANSNASATLLDSGNFVFRELDSNGSVTQVLWESFDYPTDTLLPGMKLGINLKTGHTLSLTSWRSDEVPASGSFTFGVDSNGTGQLVIWRLGNVYWTSGLWSNGSFDNVRQLSYEDYYNFSYVSNENEKYLSYSVNEISTSPMFYIGPDGQMRGDEGIASIGGCHLRNHLGCKMTGNSPECRKPNYFLVAKAKSIVGDGFKYDKSYNLSDSDCKEICWNNCSCVAYATNNGTGCEIWVQGMSFEEHFGTYDDRQFYFLYSKRGRDVALMPSLVAPRRAWEEGV